jgi:striatin 1/3/4
MDMGPQMQGNGTNQPQATEYTLQGVMRFLQTEWHRHERDRNAWEIEKQEMKGRIASLEGQARRSDATQKALRKYVAILERKVKDQAAQLKGNAATDADEAAKNDRATQIQEKLKGEEMPTRRQDCALSFIWTDTRAPYSCVREVLDSWR